MVIYIRKTGIDLHIVWMGLDNQRQKYSYYVIIQNLLGTSLARKLTVNTILIFRLFPSVLAKIRFPLISKILFGWPFNFT